MKGWTWRDDAVVVAGACGIVVFILMLAWLADLWVSDTSDEHTPAYVETVAVIEGEPSLLYVRLDDEVHLLPRCLHEDDEDDCFWAAKWRGNGEGSNFLVIDTEVIYY